MTLLDSATASLVEVTVRSNFDAVPPAVQSYADALGALLPRLAPPERLRRLEDATALIEWSRRNLCAARARLADEIRRLDSVHRFHQTLAANEITLDRE
jgi:hypothetical protein